MFRILFSIPAEDSNTVIALLNIITTNFCHVAIILMCTVAAVTILWTLKLEVAAQASIHCKVQ